MVAGDSHGHTRVWSLADGALRCELPQGAGIRAAAFDPTGERFAVAGNDGAVLLARAEECRPGRAPQTTALRAGRGRMSSVAAGVSVLLGDGTGRVSRWEPGAWRLQQSVQVHQGEISEIAVLPDGRWISGGDDRLITLSGKRLGELTNVPYALQPAPDGASVLAVDAAGTLTRLPLDGSAPADLLRVEGELYTLAVRPGKAEVVTSGVLRDLYRLTLPSQGAPTRWPWAGRSFTALAYGAPRNRALGCARELALEAAVLAAAGDLHDDRRAGLVADVVVLVVPIKIDRL